MNTLSNQLLATCLHLLELLLAAAIAIGIAVAAHNLLGADMSDAVIGLLTLVLSGVAKFARVSPDVPVPDYVNAPMREE